jgi:phenylpropionate dioxygenase-like ring-hydroxylating dioxygenase large terminal subunit
MAMAREAGYRPGLVDLKAGRISREIFVNDEIYQEELERVFARAWLFVGHESQIPEPGDFFVSGMGEESVILCRDRAGQVHVFLNSCRHRGMKVCRYDEGNTPIFTCPYHGWSYGTDGKLVGVPYFKEAYHSRLDKARLGLVEVPQLCLYKGTVWATWDPQAPPFLDYLGDFARYLDQTLDSWDGGDGGTEILGGIQKWRVPCNWKFPAENFSGDSYHNISHRSVDLVGIGPSGAGRRDMPELNLARKLHVAIPERGHQTTAYLLPRAVAVPPAYQNSSVVSDYFRECEQARRRREWGRLITLVGEVFPSMAFLARQPRTIAVWHPRGAHETEVWRWYLVDKAAPKEVKDFLRDYYIRYSGPGGMTEQDDMENWNYAHAASRGTIARRFPYSYEQGIGAEIANYEREGLHLPGVVCDITEAKSSEHNLRNLYRRWAQFMEADSWDALATWRHPAQATAAE